MREGMEQLAEAVDRHHGISSPSCSRTHTVITLATWLLREAFDVPVGSEYTSKTAL